MDIITKSKNLLREKKQKEFLDKSKSYIRYMILSAWFKLSLKETDPDLKKVNKNWIIYTYLKHKYSKFLKKYEAKENKIHEYSDIVWWCWFQGEEKAPDIVKACLESVRNNMPGKKIIVITEDNMWNYVSMPDFIKEKYKKGIISRTHFSDLLRLELLITYGGLWIDSTVLCTAEPAYAFNKPLFVFKTNEKNDPATAAQSWFIYSEKNNPILCLTRELHYKYWKKHNTQIHYFIFYFFMKLAAEKYKAEWNSIPFFSDVPPHIMQRELFTEYSDERTEQLKRMSDIHKLTYKFKKDSDLQKENTIYKKILEEYNVSSSYSSALKNNGGGDNCRVIFTLHTFSLKGECA